MTTYTEGLVLASSEDGALSGQWKLAVADPSRSVRLHGPEPITRARSENLPPEWITGYLPDGRHLHGDVGAEPNAHLPRVRRTGAPA